MVLSLFVQSVHSSPFPSKYRIKGIWSIPYWQSIYEPIEIHTDLSSEPKRQAIINYNGIASSILLTNSTNSTKYTIQASPNGTNCLATVSGEPTDPIEFLPDYTTSDWENQGYTVVLGKNVTKYHRQDPDVSNWYYDFYIDAETSDPVRYFMHGASIQHSHPADYYFDISEWGPTIDESAFVPPSTCDTRSFPGPTLNKKRFMSSDMKKTLSDAPWQDYCPIVTDTEISEEIPENFSWRDRGILPRPRDQANCGSCWAQSSGQAISAQLSLRTGKQQDISVQQIVDCVWYDVNQTNFACAGGDGWSTYEMLIENHIDLTSEASYPYIGVGGYCSTPKTDLIARVTGCRQLNPKGDKWEDRAPAIKRTLYKYGPLMVYIVASQPDFYPLQKGTIYSDPTCMPDSGLNDGVDHGVLLTGWKVINGTPTWEIMNSWSDLWADDGFGYIDMKYDCGINSMMLWPDVESISQDN